jgi:large subunit ribosomal protein L15
MPLARRLPKRGFTNIFGTEYQVVNVGQLAGLAGDVDPVALRGAGLIRSLRKPVKILGVGEVSAVLNVSAHAFSGSAREKIEAAGGSATVIGASEEA